MATAALKDPFLFFLKLEPADKKVDFSFRLSSPISLAIGHTEISGVKSHSDTRKGCQLYFWRLGGERAGLTPHHGGFGS